MGISLISTASVFASNTVTLDVTAGDLILVQMRDDSNARLSVSGDDLGTIFRPAFQPNGHNLAVYYGIAPGTDATDVITCTLPGGNDGVLAASFRADNGFDESCLNSIDWVTGVLTTSTGISTSIADMLIVGCAQRNGTGSAWSAGSGFTMVVQDASNVQGMEWRTVASLLVNQTYSITNGSGGGPFIVLAFNESQGGGGGGSVPMFAYVG